MTRSLPIRVVVALLLLAIGGCNSSPKETPTEPRYNTPGSHRKGASFLYEGTLLHELIVRRRGVPAPPIRRSWKIGLRDVLLGEPGEGGVEIATYARLQEEGDAAPFEGAIFDVHEPGGQVRPVVGERAFHPAMALLHLPRQAGLPEGAGGPGHRWEDGARLKLSNQGVLEVEFDWEGRPSAPEDAGTTYLRREWERPEGEGRGYARSGRFLEEFWIHPGEGHLVRYRRAWLISWGGQMGGADAEEHLELEIRLVRQEPPEGGGVPGPVDQMERLREILGGFGSMRGRREATTRRIEEYRRDFPSSPFGGVLPPIEASILRLQELEKIGTPPEEEPPG